MTSLPLPSQAQPGHRRHVLTLRRPMPRRQAHQPIPNNFGPTLLLALGVVLAPLLIGLPFVLWGLARIRDAQGAPALPWLASRLPGLIGRGSVPS